MFAAGAWPLASYLKVQPEFVLLGAPGVPFMFATSPMLASLQGEQRCVPWSLLSIGIALSRVVFVLIFVRVFGKAFGAAGVLLGISVAAALLYFTALVTEAVSESPPVEPREDVTETLRKLADLATRAFSPRKSSMRRRRICWRGSRRKRTWPDAPLASRPHGQRHASRLCCRPSRRTRRLRQLLTCGSKYHLLARL